MSIWLTMSNYRKCELPYRQMNWSIGGTGILPVFTAWKAVSPLSAYKGTLCEGL